MGSSIDNSKQDWHVECCLADNGSDEVRNRQTADVGGFAAIDEKAVFWSAYQACYDANVLREACNLLMSTQLMPNLLIIEISPPSAVSREHEDPPLSSCSERGASELDLVAPFSAK